MKTPISTKTQREEQALESAHRAALRRIREGHEQALAAIRDRYPQTEREGWHELVQDAQAGEGECLTEYAKALDITEADAADRVLAARQGYRQSYGQATGKLTRLRDEVDAAETLDELEAIQW